MLKTKKILACLLAGAMAASCLAACSGSSNSSGSGGSSDGQNEETVKLTWYMPVQAQADHDSVEEKWNEYLKDKLNCTLDIVEIDSGNYAQRMQTTIAGQTQFDLCYTSHWLNDFYSNVNKNAYLPLDDLLDKYAPDLMEEMPVNGWEAVTVGGKIMAVPNQQVWAMTNAIYVVKEYVDKYNFDASKVKTLKDLEPLFAAVKADNPDIYPLFASSVGILDFLTIHMGYDELAGRHIPGVIMLDDEDMTVINQFELPQVQEHYKLMHEWSQKGYIRQDAATLQDDKAGLLAGKYIADFDGTMKPGGKANHDANFGKETVEIQLSDSWLPTSGVTATLTAVSRTSAHPEKAVEFLNLVNTDKELYNLITQGIEGKHYNKIDDDYISPIENSGYAPNMDWAYGNQFLAYLKEGQESNVWEATLELNESAKASPALGFSFDSTPVRTEMASVGAVKDEYELSLDTGALDPAKALPEFLEKLEAAGSQTIIDEIQKQLDEWKAAQK